MAEKKTKASEKFFTFNNKQYAYDALPKDLKRLYDTAVESNNRLKKLSEEILQEQGKKNYIDTQITERLTEVYGKPKP